MVDGIDNEALEESLREKPDKDAEERAIKNILS